MASALGERIRTSRLKRGMTLRELSRRVSKSPAFIVKLEKSTEIPAVSEDTLRRVAQELEIAADELIVLAGKFPSDAVPRDETDVRIYRMVRQLSHSKRKKLESFFQE